jgi:hypothetical protein
LAVLTDEDPEVQEMNAVVGTAQLLYENHSEKEAHQACDST